MTSPRSPPGGGGGRPSPAPGPPPPRGTTPERGRRERMSTEKPVPAQAPQTVSLADENGVREIVADAVLRLWEVVNNLTRLRPTRRERYRVTIFGSARI